MVSPMLREGSTPRVSSMSPVKISRLLKSNQTRQRIGNRKCFTISNMQQGHQSPTKTIERQVSIKFTSGLKVVPEDPEEYDDKCTKLINLESVSTFETINMNQPPNNRPSKIPLNSLTSIELQCSDLGITPLFSDKQSFNLSLPETDQLKHTSAKPLMETYPASMDSIKSTEVNNE